MKSVHFIFFIVIFSIITGCNSINKTTPDVTKTQSILRPMSTDITKPTNTNDYKSTTTPIPTIKIIQTPTLNQTPSYKVISSALQETEQCDSPCFLGIEPGKTTLNEVEELFNHLGFPFLPRNWGENTFYEIKDLKIEKDLQFSLSVAIKDELVNYIRIDLYPEKQQEGVPRKWNTFSIEKMIQKYGNPTWIDFNYSDAGETNLLFLEFIFKTSGIQIEYTNLETDLEDSLQFCPRSDQFFAISVYFGLNFDHEPMIIYPVERVTNLSFTEFLDILTNKNSNDCVLIDRLVFSQQRH